MKHWSLVFLLSACGVNPTTTNADIATTQDPIVDVTQSSVKNQSIGNCWIYATASWAESEHKSVTGEEVNLSETYWTYWHFYDQVLNGWDNEIQTGGWFASASAIASNYGYMLEADFIPAEATQARSTVQATALAALNASLTSGDLAANRRDPAKVRAALDAAFGLSDDVKAALAQAFGDGSRTFEQQNAVAGGIVHQANELSAYAVSPTATPGAPTKSPITLRQALDQWHEVSYPATAASRRTLQIRMQRALHDRQPVILSWFVDFNSADGQGRFVAPPATPGRQGGHMVVLEDYEITNVPGFGTLPAGVNETRTDALQAALSPAATISFLRVKNSWGNWQVRLPDFAGYHDLYMTYLDAQLKQCAVDANENPDVNNCSLTTGFTSLILPTSY